MELFTFAPYGDFFLTFFAAEWNLKKNIFYLLFWCFLLPGKNCQWCDSLPIWFYKTIKYNHLCDLFYQCRWIKSKKKSNLFAHRQMTNNHCFWISLFSFDGMIFTFRIESWIFDFCGNFFWNWKTSWLSNEQRHYKPKTIRKSITMMIMACWFLCLWQESKKKEQSNRSTLFELLLLNNLHNEINGIKIDWFSFCRWQKLFPVNSFSFSDQIRKVLFLMWTASRLQKSNVSRMTWSNNWTISEQIWCIHFDDL